MFCTLWFKEQDPDGWNLMHGWARYCAPELRQREKRHDPKRRVYVLHANCRKGSGCTAHIEWHIPDSNDLRNRLVYRKSGFPTLAAAKQEAAKALLKKFGHRKIMRGRDVDVI